MRCEQIRDLLSPYIDNMTNEKEKQAVEAHILECAECRRELEELQAFCVALKRLDSPSVPADFSQDLHKRLIEENGRVFAAKKLKKPRKTGWIAAGVAGIALTAGIYVSSLLPPLGQIALFQDDKEKVEPKKPSMAVEDILERIKGPDYDKEIIINTPVSIAENENAEVQISTDNKENKSPETNPVDSGDTDTAPENAQGTEPVVADIYSTRVKVNNIEESITRLIEIADNNKAEYALMPNGTTAQASSDVKAKELVLKLDSKNVEAVLSELQKIGKLSEPEYEELVLTQQLDEANRHINFLEQQLEIIKSNEEISEAEQAKFEELSSELENWQQQKASLEKTVNGVTLKVYIIEEITSQ